MGIATRAVHTELLDVRTLEDINLTCSLDFWRGRTYIENQKPCGWWDMAYTRVPERVFRVWGNTAEQFLGGVRVVAGDTAEVAGGAIDAGLELSAFIRPLGLIYSAPGLDLFGPWA
jgi:hypothetical protein